MCSNLVEKDVPVEQVSHVIGHKDIKTTHRYITQIQTQIKAKKAHAAMVRGEAAKEEEKKEPEKIPEKKREVKAKRKQRGKKEESLVPSPDEIADAEEVWKKPLTKFMKKWITGGKGTATLYDLGADRDAFKIHKEFAKIKALGKAIYLDMYPVPPPKRVKIMKMETRYMDLAKKPDDLELLIDKHDDKAPVFFARWFFCHLSDEQAARVLEIAAGSNAQFVIMESTGEKSIKEKYLEDGSPFFERNDKHWHDLFEKHFVVK